VRLKGAKPGFGCARTVNDEGMLVKLTSPSTASDED